MSSKPGLGRFFSKFVPALFAGFALFFNAVMFILSGRPFLRILHVFYYSVYPLPYGKTYELDIKTVVQSYQLLALLSTVTYGVQCYLNYNDKTRKYVLRGISFKYFSRLYICFVIMERYITLNLNLDQPLMQLMDYTMIKGLPFPVTLTTLMLALICCDSLLEMSCALYSGYVNTDSYVIQHYILWCRFYPPSVLLPVIAFLQLALFNCHYNGSTLLNIYSNYQPTKDNVADITCAVTFFVWSVASLMLGSSYMGLAEIERKEGYARWDQIGEETVKHNNELLRQADPAVVAMKKKARKEESQKKIDSLGKKKKEIVESKKSK